MESFCANIRLDVRCKPLKDREDETWVSIVHTLHVVLKLESEEDGRFMQTLCGFSSLDVACHRWHRFVEARPLWAEDHIVKKRQLARVATEREQEMVRLNDCIVPLAWCDDCHTTHVRDLAQAAGVRWNVEAVDFTSMAATPRVAPDDSEAGALPVEAAIESVEMEMDTVPLIGWLGGCEASETFAILESKSEISAPEPLPLTRPRRLPKERADPLVAERNKMACTFCRGRRIRCDGQFPEHCSRCVSSGLLCTYREHFKRGRKSNQVDPDYEPRVAGKKKKKKC